MYKHLHRRRWHHGSGSSNIVYCSDTRRETAHPRGRTPRTSRWAPSRWCPLDTLTDWMKTGPRKTLHILGAQHTHHVTITHVLIYLCIVKVDISLLDVLQSRRSGNFTAIESLVALGGPDCAAYFHQGETVQAHSLLFSPYVL